jgi:PAS domain S-box-containing protein
MARGTGFERATVACGETPQRSLQSLNHCRRQWESRSPEKRRVSTKAPQPTLPSAEALIDVAPMAIAMTDHELRILRHSPSWLTELGISDLDIVGRTLSEVFPKTAAAMADALQAALTGKKLPPGALWVTLRDGRRVRMRCESSAWRHKDGTIGGLLLSVTDATGMHEALEHSRSVERRLKIATAIADLHVFEVDYANQTLTIDGADNTFFEDPPTFEQMAADPFCGVHDGDR